MGSGQEVDKLDRISRLSPPEQHRIWSDSRDAPVVVFASNCLDRQRSERDLKASGAAQDSEEEADEQKSLASSLIGTAGADGHSVHRL